MIDLSLNHEFLLVGKAIFDMDCSLPFLNSKAISGTIHCTRMSPHRPMDFTTVHGRARTTASTSRRSSSATTSMILFQFSPSLSNANYIISNSKFVDSHLKPYRCRVHACENSRFSSTACLLRHEREAHAMQGHHHVLLTPRASPNQVVSPNQVLLSPRASMSNASALDPSITGQMYTAPFYPPSTGVSNPPPLLPHQSLQYPANTYTLRPYYSIGYQEYQYPQNPQTNPFLTANIFGSDAFTPVTLVPGVCASLEPNSGRPPIPSAESLGSIERENSSTESIESMSRMSSNSSDPPSEISFFEVLTPQGLWDEPLGLKDSSGFESEFKASTDQDFTFDDFLFPAGLTDFVEQSLTGCNETSPSPPNTTNEDLCLSATISSKTNLKSLPGQVSTDRNLDMNTKLYPGEPAETPPKKVSRSSVLSNVLRGHEQGGDQSKSMANENGTERRDFQIPVSQNLGFASKHHCNEDIRTSIEALPTVPLLCATKSVINTTPGHDLTYDDQQQPPSPSPFFRSASETCSWFSDDETDWGDDESDDAHRTIGTLVIEGSNILGEQELPNLVSRPVLSKMKQELVDRIMVEFWQIFNQEKEINMYVSHCHTAIGEILSTRN
jgi:hypothetical protein